MDKLQKKGQAVSVIVLAVILLVSIYLMNRSVAYNDEDYCQLSADWEIQMDQEIYSDVDLGIFHFRAQNTGNYIKMQATMPERVINNPVLRLYTIHSEVSVELDSEEIYHYGKELNEQDRLLGYGYHYINLPNDYMGKTLTIQLWITEDNAFTYLETPTICNSMNEMRNYVIQKKVPLAVNLFLIVFGICLLPVSMMFLESNCKFSKLVCVAGFSIGIGCWSLCNYDLITLFTYNLRVKVFMEFIALYASPLFVLLYFWEEATRRRSKILKALYYLALTCQSIFIVVSLVLQAVNLVHLPEVLKYEHIILILSFSMVVAATIYDFKRHNVHNKALILGIGIMIFIGLTDIVRFNLDKYLETGLAGRYTSNLCIGALVFVLAQLVDFSMEISQVLYENAQRDALERMAYTDELTGVANRRKCEEEWDLLENADNYGIIAFDLNHLKKTNDSKGHDKGDILIKSFAKCIQDVFGKYATVGRMGGDEFAVIFQDISQISMEEMIAAYRKEIKECNRRNPDLNMSAAYGFCSKKEAPDLDARGIYRKADARMYERKVAMKCERKEE